MQIRLISRGRNDFGSRAILNEDEIVKAIHHRYADTVDVNIIKFSGSLSTAMLAMNATDVLIGVHGAGESSYMACHDVDWYCLACMRVVAFSAAVKQALCVVPLIAASHLFVRPLSG